MTTNEEQKTNNEESSKKQEWIDLNLQFPDGGEEVVPIEKESFLWICETANKENKTVENKFLELLNEMIDAEFKKGKEEKQQ